MGYCDWARANQLLKTYHDTEWGIPVDDDQKMFEHLMLECLQCGLSWNLILQKREIFRKCFDHFDFEKIAAYKDSQIENIFHSEGMLKSKRKILAVVENARASLEIKREFGSLCHYFWQFSQGKIIRYEGHKKGQIPVSNGLSEKIGKDLKKRGFRYVGSITVYSHLQACGIIDDHEEDCPAKKIFENHPILELPRDCEKF